MGSQDPLALRAHIPVMLVLPPSGRQTVLERDMRRHGLARCKRSIAAYAALTIFRSARVNAFSADPGFHYPDFQDLLIGHLHDVAVEDDEIGLFTNLEGTGFLFHES